MPAMTLRAEFVMELLAYNLRLSAHKNDTLCTHKGVFVAVSDVPCQVGLALEKVCIKERKTFFFYEQK